MVLVIIVVFVVVDVEAPLSLSSWMTSSRSAREVTIAVRVFAAGVAAALRVFCVSPSCERFTKYHLEVK